MPCNKSKLYKTLDYWFRAVLKFSFPEKGLGLVFPPHFVYDFSRIMFLMLYSINWTNFIVRLPLFLEGMVEKGDQVLGPRDPQYHRIPWTIGTPRPLDTRAPWDIRVKLPLRFGIQGLNTQKLWNWSINSGPSYNQFHNILRLFDVLPNFPFTTSETMCDNYLQPWYIRVTSHVAERLKT